MCATAQRRSARLIQLVKIVLLRRVRHMNAPSRTLEHLDPVRRFHGTPRTPHRRHRTDGGRGHEGPPRHFFRAHRSTQTNTTRSRVSCPIKGGGAPAYPCRLVISDRPSSLRSTLFVAARESVSFRCSQHLVACASPFDSDTSSDRRQNANTLPTFCKGACQSGQDGPQPAIVPLLYKPILVRAALQAACEGILV